MSDIVERLLAPSEVSTEWRHVALHHDAAEEITRLRARVEVLERELRGIVDFCEEGHRQPYVAIANIARAALKEAAP